MDRLRYAQQLTTQTRNNVCKTTTAESAKHFRSQRGTIIRLLPERHRVEHHKRPAVLTWDLLRRAEAPANQGSIVLAKALLVKSFDQRVDPFVIRRRRQGQQIIECERRVNQRRFVAPKSQVLRQECV